MNRHRKYEPGVLAPLLGLHFLHQLLGCPCISLSYQPADLVADEKSNIKNVLIAIDNKLFCISNDFLEITHAECNYVYKHYYWWKYMRPT